MGGDHQGCVREQRRRHLFIGMAGLGSRGRLWYIWRPFQLAFLSVEFEDFRYRGPGTNTNEVCKPSKCSKRHQYGHRLSMIISFSCTDLIHLLFCAQPSEEYKPLPLLCSKMVWNGSACLAWLALLYAMLSSSLSMFSWTRLGNAH